MSANNAILALLKRVSNHYNLDYSEVLSLCDMSTPSREKKEKKKLELEFITINKKSYLYHAETNQVYSNDKHTRHIGYLCTDSFEIVLV